jgi:hypothetical protein
MAHETNTPRSKPFRGIHNIAR